MTDESSKPLEDGPPKSTATDAPHPSSESASPGPSNSRANRHVRRIDVSLQGEDLGRIIALSDGVFAFAMTLLVLSLVVPSTALVDSNSKLGGALNHDWPTFFGYAFAFVMIGVWWVVHNRTYQYIARFDSTLVWLNMMLLAQIAVMPFVLSVYTAFGTGADGGPGFPYAVDLFASIQITLGLTITGTWEYARRRGFTKPNIPADVSRYFTRRGIYTAAVFGLSIGIAFVNVAWAQYSWALIFVVQRILTIEGD